LCRVKFFLKSEPTIAPAGLRCLARCFCPLAAAPPPHKKKTRGRRAKAICSLGAAGILRLGKIVLGGAAPPRGSKGYFGGTPIFPVFFYCAFPESWEKDFFPRIFPAARRKKKGERKETERGIAILGGQKSRFCWFFFGEKKTGWDRFLSSMISGLAAQLHLKRKSETKTRK